MFHVALALVAAFTAIAAAVPAQAIGGWMAPNGVSDGSHAATTRDRVLLAVDLAPRSL